MTNAPLGLLLHHLREAGAAASHEASDGDLLHRFAAGREEAAFAALLHRHGPMVLAVCRRVLNDDHDAEDALQATFLVLARKAGSIRKGESVASWLHGVGYRVALEARTRAARRRRHERQAGAQWPVPSGGGPERDELRALLDGELRRLPEKYRAPLVLHYLEGKTKQETARQLGWSEGTVSGRLARARDVLRGRLARRGLTVSAGVLAAALAGMAAPPVSAGVADATLRAALAFAAGRATSGEAAALAGAVLRGMLVSRLLRAWTVLLAVGLLALATGLAPGLARRGDPGARGEGTPASDAANAPGPEAGGRERIDRFGDPLPPGAVLRLGTVRLRHGSRVTGLAYSPDGRTLLSGSADRTLRLWDLATGKELRRFTNPDQLQVESMALSPDGRLAALGSQGHVRVWDVATGVQRLDLEAGGAGVVYSVAFSPDDKTLAAGTGTSGAAGRVRLWEVATGRLLQTLPEPHTHDVRLAFSPDGSLLATSGDDGTIRLWHADTDIQERELRGHTRTLQSLAFSRDGQRLLSAGHDNTLRLWDVPVGKELPPLFRGDPPPKDQGYLCSPAVFSPDGKYAAWATSAREKDHFGTLLYFWETATGKVVRKFNDSPSVLAFAPDGKTLATGDAGGGLTLWDTATAKEVSPLPFPAARPWHLVVAPDGRTLIGSEDPDVVVRDAATAKERRRWRAAEGTANPFELTHMALLADGRRLLTTGWGPTVRVWDVPTGKLLHRFDDDKYIPLAFSPDGKYLITSASMEQTELQLWDVAAGKVLRRFGSGDKAVFSPDGKTLAVCPPDGGLTFWDVATGKEADVRLRADPEEIDAIYGLAFAPDGRRLVTAAYGNPGIRLWDLATGKELRRRDGAGDVAFSPDGRTLATGGDDHNIHLCDVDSGKERAVLRGHEGPVAQIVFFPDGSRLLTRSDDGTALVWDLTAAEK
jgi:RNA polymerase sigma factor (sigma-70 family)